MKYTLSDAGRRATEGMDDASRDLFIATLRYDVVHHPDGTKSVWLYDTEKNSEGSYDCMGWDLGKGRQGSEHAVDDLGELTAWSDTSAKAKQIIEKAAGG